MEIEFLKMQGCAEDVVVMDAARVPLGAQARLPELAHRILSRHLGVGGNALLVLFAASGTTLPARAFDPDGDEMELSCNAARCVARYASDSGLVSHSDFFLKGLAETARIQIIDSAHVRMDLGVPFTGEKTAEIRESNRESFTRSILVEGRAISYTPISLGRPYAMLFVPDFSFPLRKTARAIAAQPDFPDGTGIGFVQVVSREQMRLRVWEAEGEGLGDQCICAAAALVASVVSGFSDRESFVRVQGGDLFLQWDERDSHLWVTGPAGYVFTGTYDFPDEIPE
jgi:diaminopimelate epimerase